MHSEAAIDSDPPLGCISFGVRTVTILLITLCLSAMKAPGSGDALRPGLSEMFLEYVSVRYPGLDLSQDMLYVSVARQRMFHLKDGRFTREYVISTAHRGTGSRVDSRRTPLGLHVVQEKIGADTPPFGVLKERSWTGEIAWEDETELEDVITSRILWLAGLEAGVNKGEGIDSWDRFIYIHGTAAEARLGTPASEGCVRMKNADIIDLFDRVAIGTPVLILDN